MLRLRGCPRRCAGQRLPLCHAIAHAAAVASAGISMQLGAVDAAGRWWRRTNCSLPNGGRGTCCWHCCCAKAVAVLLLRCCRLAVGDILQNAGCCWLPALRGSCGMVARRQRLRPLGIHMRAVPAALWRDGRPERPAVLHSGHCAEAADGASHVGTLA